MKVLEGNNDNLGIMKDQKLFNQLFHGQAIIFSDKVKKINQSEWSQDRGLVITIERIYNIKSKKIQREF